VPQRIAQEPSYADRIAREHAIFDAELDVHALPAIYHYWSNRYLLPMEQALGFDHPYDFFAQSLLTAAKGATSTARFISLGAGNCDAESISHFACARSASRTSRSNAWT